MLNPKPRPGFPGSGPLISQLLGKKGNEQTLAPTNVEQQWSQAATRGKREVEVFHF